MYLHGSRYFVIIPSLIGPSEFESGAPAEVWTACASNLTKQPLHPCTWARNTTPSSAYWNASVHVTLGTFPKQRYLSIGPPPAMWASRVPPVPDVPGPRASHVCSAHPGSGFSPSLPHSHSLHSSGLPSLVPLPASLMFRRPIHPRSSR